MVVHAVRPFSTRWFISAASGNPLSVALWPRVVERALRFLCTFAVAISPPTAPRVPPGTAIRRRASMLSGRARVFPSPGRAQRPSRGSNAHLHVRALPANGPKNQADENNKPRKWLRSAPAAAIRLPTLHPAPTASGQKRHERHERHGVIAKGLTRIVSERAGVTLCVTATYDVVQRSVGGPASTRDRSRGSGCAGLGVDAGHSHSGLRLWARSNSG